MNKDKLIKMGMPKRTVYALANGGVDSLEKLIHSSSEELLGIPNIGMKSIKSIKKLLAEFNLELNGDL